MGPEAARGDGGGAGQLSRALPMSPYPAMPDQRQDDCFSGLLSAVRWLSAPQPEAYSPHAYTVTAHRPIQAKEQLSQQLY